MISKLLVDRLKAVEERLVALHAERAGTGHRASSGAGPDREPEPGVQRAGQWSLAPWGEVDRLAVLARDFGLSPMEVDLLVCAMLPELNPFCGGLIRQLTGAQHSSRPTVALALDMMGISMSEGLVRGLLCAESAPLAAGLLKYENPDAVHPGRLLRIPDRVLGHLVGARQSVAAALERTCGPCLRAVVDSGGPAVPWAIEALSRAWAIAAGSPVYVRERAGGVALPAACEALRRAGTLPLLVDPDELEHSPADLPEAMVLEARLLHGGIIVPVFTDPDVPAAGLLRRLIARLTASRVPVVLYGSGEWDPEAWGPTPHTAMELTAPPAGTAESRGTGRDVYAGLAPLLDQAQREAAVRGRHLAEGEVRRIVHSGALRNLGRLARQVSPAVTTNDLVLAEAARERLDALLIRARHRDEVLDTWRLRRGGGRGRGVTALFAGDSGTGKTMAAEAVAAELGVPLSVVSLPSLVSKYIGETEKNLERVFSAAEVLNGVLLFDEADAVFAKRGEVRGSNDRHANLQSGYLLQRLESFDGLAILTTNLRANLDSAFTRRFDEVIEFERPGTEVRVRLWRGFLGDGAADSCGIEDIAARFDLCGGSIRACVETAAFMAVAHDRPLCRADLFKGIEVEYRKLGRLFDGES